MKKVITILSGKIPNDSDSHSTNTAKSCDTLECVLACDSPNKTKITQQLNGYARFIQKKIMFEKQEKGEPISGSSSKYEIKIKGTLDALKSAVETLVFADVYDKDSCSLPPSLMEYAEQLLNGHTDRIASINRLVKDGVTVVAEESAIFNGSIISGMSFKIPFKDKDGNVADNIIARLPGHVYWMDKNNKFLGCNDLQAKNAGLSSRHEIVGRTKEFLNTKQDQNQREINLYHCS
eukprot:gene6838-9361_t